jgi:SAM-dependent methyltransferase
VDVIVVNKVLHHCFPLQNVMPALLRWLKPGGTFVAIEPVSYLKSLEWLRKHSLVPYGPLDEGERKLGPEDMRYIAGLFSESQTHHFRVVGRLDRIWHKGERLFRRIDRVILSVPMAWRFAGTAVFVGQH